LCIKITSLDGEKESETPFTYFDMGNIPIKLKDSLDTTKLDLRFIESETRESIEFWISKYQNKQTKREEIQVKEADQINNRKFLDNPSSKEQEFIAVTKYDHQQFCSTPYGFCIRFEIYQATPEYDDQGFVTMRPKFEEEEEIDFFCEERQIFICSQ